MSLIPLGHVECLSIGKILLHRKEAIILSTNTPAEGLWEMEKLLNTEMEITCINEADLPSGKHLW